jgi:hypothetical protein
MKRSTRFHPGFGGLALCDVTSTNVVDRIRDTVGEAVGAALGMFGIKSDADEDAPPVTVPARDKSRPKDDPWDADAVRYLLSQDGVAEEWAPGVLTECLRRASKRMRDDGDRVKKAGALAKTFGVEQRDEARGKSTTVRLCRTDSAAPTYPASAVERRSLLRDS